MGPADDRRLLFCVQVCAFFYCAFCVETDKQKFDGENERGVLFRCPKENQKGLRLSS